MAYLDTKIAVEKIICNRGHQTWPLHVGASEATFFSCPKASLFILLHHHLVLRNTVVACRINLSAPSCCLYFSVSWVALVDGSTHESSELMMDCATTLLLTWCRSIRDKKQSSTIFNVIADATYTNIWPQTSNIHHSS